MRIRNAILLTALLLACDSPLDVIIDQVASRHRSWTRLGIDDYSFTYQQSCFCPPDAIQAVRITVVNGAITSVRTAANDAPVSNLDWFQTIDGLFERLESHLRIDRATLSVDFHPQQFFPTHAEGDIRLTQDAAFTFTVSNFTSMAN
jgi:hypothetical protein